MGNTTKAPAESDGDLEITELVEFEPDRLDGVKTAATGIPFLVMKSAATAAVDTDAGATAGTPRPFPDGTEQPAHMDLTGQHMHLHHAHGGPDANGDGLHQHVHSHSGDHDHDHDHDAGDDTGADDSWKSAAAGVLDEAEIRAALEDAVKAKLSRAEINDLPDSAFAYIEDGGKKDADGKTTPRSKRHFPIHDKEHADNAAARIAQGAEFGDKAKRKVMAAQRKFGESSDTSKGTVAEGETGVQTDAQGTDGLSKAVEDAVTKATKPLAERIETLSAELAKVKATPLPGGPVLSNVRPIARTADGDDWAAKAALYRAKADVATTPADAEGYRQLAREADKKAQAATA